MKKLLFSVIITLLPTVILSQSVRMSVENRMEQPLNQVMGQIEKQFGVKFSYNVDTTGLVVSYAPGRIRPYSLDESLQNVLSAFDFKAWKQNDSLYKIKPYEYYRRFDADGQKMTDYLSSLYSNRQEWESRARALRKAVREASGVDALLESCVDLHPILGKTRKYNGYTVQNIALELVPGYYVCGSIYSPNNKAARKQVANGKGQYPVIISPNGHWADGRYNKDLQVRYATLARMGAISISFDLFGWGESELQVGAENHATSIAMTYQLVSTIRLLDYALTRKDADPSRIGACGGSGGGTHSVLLATIDPRFSACCPVAHITSHFDGGCPCESGLPVQYVLGGTTSAEMLATMAPKPIMLVGDEGDWTHTHPDIEVPFLKRIYGFYNATDQVQNIFLPGEKHDFRISKRQGVYAYFSSVWNLAEEMQDENKATIETADKLFSFGATRNDQGKIIPSGAAAPANFERSILNLAETYFDKQLYFDVRWAANIEKKADKWADSLHLNDAAKTLRVRNLIYNHLTQITKWHNEHVNDCPRGINPRTGEVLREVDLQIIADAAQPKEYHTTLMDGLRAELTPEQVETVLDLYTIGKVQFTLNGYHSIVPDITPTEDSICLAYLKEAREMAIDYKTMKEISEIFGIAKDKCEAYFNSHGRNWRAMYSAYVKKLQAEKKRQKK
jgi:hypothetical protein